MTSIASRLLAWYDAQKRDLPWRESQDAYCIWVSEIMLQQTRVEAVKGYYARWMERFPTVQVLAIAEEEEVLQHWQGLGYYARARNLHKAAQVVATTHGGKLPKTVKEILSLPGIGEYTAGAIASIAYGQCVPAVDGNVLRIYSRLHVIEDDILQTRVKKAITKLVEQDVPLTRSGDFNQALMDLGSAVCIPGNPRCQRCPLVELCNGYAVDKAETLPIKRVKKPSPVIRLAAVVLQYQGKVLLHQRPKKGLLAGMWEFPTVEISDGQETVRSIIEYWEKQWGIGITVGQALMQVKHVFTHRQWDLTFFEAQLSKTEIKRLPTHFVWHSEENLDTVLWAGPHQKVFMEKKL